jgi:hypothetical protein
LQLLHLLLEKGFKIQKELLDGEGGAGTALNSPVMMAAMGESLVAQTAFSRFFELFYRTKNR